MINIVQNQTVAENDTLHVSAPSGSYDDSALVPFYDEKDPSSIIGAYAAQFIKYGSMVYKFSDTTELGREILKIDPNSTHSAASLVRMQDELKKQFEQGSLEISSLDQITTDEQQSIQDQVVNPITDPNLDTGTSTPATNLNDTSTSTPSTATSTPVVSNNNQNATSTPVITLDPTPTSVSSTTPIIIDQGTSTTTQATSTDPVSSNTSTTTPAQILPAAVIDALGASTTPATPSDSPSPSPAPSQDNASTTSDIVSYAKNAIKNKVVQSVKKKYLS